MGVGLQIFKNLFLLRKGVFLLLAQNSKLVEVFMSKKQRIGKEKEKTSRITSLVGKINQYSVFESPYFFLKWFLPSI
jgi:hypothetical protein